MKLSKDQKNILKGGLASLAGMIIGLVVAKLFGIIKHPWSETFGFLLGPMIGCIACWLFLILGSRVPKEKGRKNE